MGNNQQTKSRCIVLDTNIMYQSKFLRDSLGPALLFEIHTTDSKIALPEIIETEMKKHFMKLCKEAIEKIKNNYSDLEKLLGIRPNYQIPNKDRIEAAFQSRIDQLSKLLLRYPCTDVHLRGALNRVIEETPPNAKDQQFKDSCIWEAIICMAQNYDVHFITNDSAFFEKDNSSLANNLQHEIDAMGCSVYIYRDIRQFLHFSKQTHAGFDYDKLLSILDNIFRTTFDGFGQNWFNISTIKRHETTVYYTEKAEELAVSFEIEYDVEYYDIKIDTSNNAIGRIKGNCMYNIIDNNVHDIHLNSVETYQFDGIMISKSAWGGSTTGSQTTIYQLREPL